MNDTITIVGTIGTDPEKKVRNGVPITTFRVASKERRFDRATGTWVDGETNWYTASAYRRLAEHAFDSLHRRERVVLTGRLRVRNWDTGEKRGTSVDIDIDAIGHDLLFGTSTFRSDEPGSAGSSTTTESWTTAETERRWVGRARRRAGRLERVRSDDSAGRLVDRRRRRAPRARTRGGGDAVLRGRDESSRWRTLDSNSVPPPRASSHAPRRVTALVRGARTRAGRLFGPRRAPVGRRRHPLPRPQLPNPRLPRRHRPRPPTPTLVPDGTAEENLPLFSAVVAGVWATPQQVTGRAYVDALVAAGFDKGAMQLTPDQSTVGNPAESIQFSVRWGQECLIGQVGPATGAPVTVDRPGPRRGHLPDRGHPPDRLVTGSSRASAAAKGPACRPVDWTGYG